MHKLLPLALATAVVSSMAQAEGHSNMRRVDAHVHGAGVVNIATEGNLLYIEAELPGSDVTGFESVRTDEQRRQVAAAKEKLTAGDMWILPAAAKCTLAEAHADVSTDVGGHEGHDHEHEAKHDDHDDHAHEKESSHLEFHASWTYRCDAPAKLTVIDTRLFKQLPTLKQVAVQALTETSQVAVKLNPAASQIKF